MRSSTKIIVALSALSLALSAAPAFAGSATWGLAPGTADWNTAGNWIPATIPNAAADTATFFLSSKTNLSISANTEVNGIVFNSGANVFTITASPAFTLTISGVGITNNSGVGQAFVTAASVSGNSGVIEFSNSATAGSNIIFTNNGATASGGIGGRTGFIDSANAGSAVINNMSATVASATEGDTTFNLNSSAANATINNFGQAGTGNAVGSTFFNSSSTAANATINNNSSMVSGGSGGATLFDNFATAGSATITNNGGTNLFGGGGSTSFFARSTAGSATITNNGGLISGGSGGGMTSFANNSTAGIATFINNGSVPGASNGETAFGDNSSADHGTFTNNGTAAVNSNGGVTDFGGSATGDHGTFTNNAATGSGGRGGVTIFDDNSTAANATLTSNGGTMSGAPGGETFFFTNADAANATLIANGGTSGGGGGLIGFTTNSTGGTSRVELFGNGELDISQHSSPGVTIGSLEGSGNVFLGANTLSVGSNNLSTTFSGVIQDGGSGGGTNGSLTKIGTGTLILSGTNTYTGVTNINAGSLIVDGSIASPDTEVNFGGLLGGTGTIGGFVINAGIVSPGDSPGTLTINGNYVEVSSSTLRIEIGGLASAQHDLLAVGGMASVANTLQLLRINNFMPIPGTRVTIITDAGGHTGTFATVDRVNWGLIQPVPMYDEVNDIYVVFELSGTFQSQALTPNQKSVAEDLDDSVGDSRAAPLIAFLGGEPTGNLPHDYDLIAPEELASIYEIGFSQAVVQNNNLERRMDDIRAGSNGFCANGFAPQVSGKDYSKESDGKISLPDKNTRDVYAPAPDNRWGVFVTGSGDFVNVGNDDSNAHGYDITTGDFTIGADYRLCEHFAIGLDAGYSSSTADLVDNGRVEVDGGKIGAYATFFCKGLFGSKFHIDEAVGGGFNSYDTRRTGLQDLLVRGSTDGSEFNAMLAYGSDWTFGCLNIGTWSTIQYTNVNIDKFTETGSLAPLEIQDQGEDSIRATTGLRASYDIKAGRAIIRPEVRAAYQHEYDETAYVIDSRFASGAGDVFRVRGPNIGRDAALVGAGLSMQWNRCLSTYVYYDGVLGRKNYDNNAVSGGLRVSF